MILLDRRRTMGKMETPKTPIEILIDMGCKMWFPLKTSGNLTDSISGLKIVQTGSSIRWMSSGNNRNWYYVIQGINNTTQGNIALNWTADDFPDGEWTTVAQSKRDPTASLRGNAGVYLVNNQYAIYCFDQNGTQVTSNWDDNIHTCVTVVTSSGRQVYVDGNLIIDDSTKPQQPWGYATMTIGSKGSYNNKRAYMRNAMVFNKALSASEIATVMNIIG